MIRASHWKEACLDQLKTSLKAIERRVRTLQLVKCSQGQMEKRAWRLKGFHNWKGVAMKKGSFLLHLYLKLIIMKLGIKSLKLKCLRFQVLILKYWIRNPQHHFLLQIIKQRMVSRWEKAANSSLAALDKLRKQKSSRGHKKLT